MNERIKKLRNKLGYTQEQFAKSIRLSRNFIAQIELGTKQPSDRTISDICRTFGVNEDWLRYGTGDMKSPDVDELSTCIEEIVHGNDAFIKDLVLSYMDLDRSSKDALMELAKNMTKRINERKLN